MSLLRHAVKRVVFSRYAPPWLGPRLVQAMRQRSVLLRTREQPITPGPCRICGGGQALHRDGGHAHAAVYKARFVRLFGCSACGHKQFLPDLTDQDLADVYSRGYWASDSEPAVYEAHYRAAHNVTAAAVVRSLAALGLHAPLRLHEFGCGTGLTVHHLRRMGIDATGSDWSPTAIGFGQAQGNRFIQQENANTLSQMRGQALDVVFTNHVLEHLPDPVGFFSKLKPLLHPGSVVFMRVPNGDALANRRFGMVFDPLFYFPHHVHYFSPRSLLLCAERAGMKVLRLVATPRITPALLGAALGDVAVGPEQVAAAEQAYQTEELEIVAALGASGRFPERSVEAARAIEPAPRDGAPLFDHSHYEEFYRADTPWSRLCRRPEGALEPMAYSPLANFFHYDSASIGDAWLQNGDGFQPVLRFRAPRAGRYRFVLSCAARFIGGLPATLLLEHEGALQRREVLEGPAPRQIVHVAQLGAGQTLDITTDGPPTQRLVCVAGVRREPA